MHPIDEVYTPLPFPMGYKGLPPDELEQAFDHADSKKVVDPLHRRMCVIGWFRDHYRTMNQPQKAFRMSEVYHELRHGEMPSKAICDMCAEIPRRESL